jgi:hypothetical protein
MVSAAVSSATERATASALLKSLAKARWMTPSAASAPARMASRSARAPRSGVAPAVVGEQLGDDGRPDQAGPAGDEDVHEVLRNKVMGLLSRHCSEVMGQRSRR